MEIARFACPTESPVVCSSNSKCAQSSTFILNHAEQSLSNIVPPYSPSLPHTNHPPPSPVLHVVMPVKAHAQVFVPVSMGELD